VTLRLLTDEHVSPAVATAAKRRCPSIDVSCLRDWQDGQMMGAPNELVLEAARGDGLTLVSYDLRTLPPLLRRYAEQGIEHAGVVLVDDKTLGQTNVGGLARALCELWRAQHRLDWQNRVVFLRR
jgi:hypothetical protein